MTLPNQIKKVNYYKSKSQRAYIELISEYKVKIYKSAKPAPMNNRDSRVSSRTYFYLI